MRARCAAFAIKRSAPGHTSDGPPIGALLLHDVGKAAKHEQGKHAEVGAALAMRAAKRLQLEANAADTVQFLVENHLLLASTSQRRDLDDVTVIRNFARQ